jgi:hypothetical protein
MESEYLSRRLSEMSQRDIDDKDFLEFKKLVEKNYKVNQKIIPENIYNAYLSYTKQDPAIAQFLNKDKSILITKMMWLKKNAIYKYFYADYTSEKSKFIGFNQQLSGLKRIEDDIKNDEFLSNLDLGIDMDTVRSVVTKLSHEYSNLEVVSSAISTMVESESIPKKYTSRKSGIVPTFKKYFSYEYGKFLVSIFGRPNYEFMSQLLQKDFPELESEDLVKTISKYYNQFKKSTIRSKKVSQ